jgi:hypothetical protein
MLLKYPLYKHGPDLRLPVHLTNDVIFSILEDRSAQHHCCVNMLCGTFKFFLAIFNLGGSSIHT